MCGAENNILTLCNFNLQEGMVTETLVLFSPNVTTFKVPPGWRWVACTAPGWEQLLVMGRVESWWLLEVQMTMGTWKLWRFIVISNGQVEFLFHKLYEHIVKFTLVLGFT